MECIKKRHIRDLKSGKKKTIAESVITKYNWTIDELEYLQPFINSKKPLEVSNTSVNKGIFTKAEVYELLDRNVTNKTTLSNYKSRVNALSTLLNIENEEFSKIFDDLDVLINAIIGKYKDPTSYFAFMLFILSKSQKLLDTSNNSFDIIKSRFDEYKNKQIVNQLNARQNDLEYERVYKSIFETEKKYNQSDYASMKHVITTMYTHALYDKNGKIHINPRNYFDNVLLIKNDKQMNHENNFYNINTGRLLINNYKTSSIYNAYDVVLSNDVRKVLSDSMKTPRGYLIEKESGGTFAKNSLSEMIKRIFGYTIDTIRKSIESYEINVKKTNRVHLAEVSRHSVMTQEVSYLARTT
uniref:Uncharacterized protein n=1 Tax=Pyramimonas orientalis virus TaxID=455367 RepID=A0A7M3UNQ0_POV01|nr:hypothetical protein HWQ62_00188 [Pyramimonas orientalis virus]